MAERTMNSLILIRSDTQTQWYNANPVLKKGEIGIELDTNRFKIGDNSTQWRSLGYYSRVIYGTLSTSGNITEFTIPGPNSTTIDVSEDINALYIDTSTKKIYRYNGSDYEVIGGGSNTLFAGLTNSTAAADSTNGNTYIHLYDQAVSQDVSKIKIAGSGATSVTTNSSGDITISTPTITGAASTVTDSNLTANKVLVSNANGKIAVSNVYKDFLESLLGGFTASDLETFTGSENNNNILTLLDKKVDKVAGKGLSTNDFTDALKTKLDGISTGANKVEASLTNGHIEIDGTDTTVYDLPVAASGVLGGIQIGYTKANQNDKIYPVQLGTSGVNKNAAYVSVNWTDNNTTYTFTSGTNGFTVQPSGGNEATTVTVTPSIANNVIYTGSLTSGRLAKWNNTSGTLEDGPAYGTTGNSVLVQTNSGGKIDASVLPDTITGQLYYKGTWDPGITPGSGPTTAPTGAAIPERGWYYIAVQANNLGVTNTSLSDGSTTSSIHLTKNAAGNSINTDRNVERGDLVVYSNNEYYWDGFQWKQLGATGTYAANYGKYDPMKVTVAQSGQYIIVRGAAYYQVGDWSVYNGISWDKIDNTDSITNIRGEAELISTTHTGNVVITKAMLGLGNVDNTSDSTKKTNFTGSIAANNTGFVTGGDVHTALSGKVDPSDVLILYGGHAGYPSTDANYDSNYEGRWTERP